MLYDPELEVGTKLESILIAIGSERKRQDLLKSWGRFLYTAADDGPLDSDRVMWIAEELGEVAKEVSSQPDYNRGALSLGSVGTRANLRKEIIQVAAICAAWLERF